MPLPLQQIVTLVDKRISVLLKDQRILEGRLVGYDDFMNLVLTDTIEKGEQERKLGKVVVRGNNIVRIALVEII
ncbi:MAG: RNA-binding protein [Thermoplasmata archaeon]|nr:RNA-binding protein [Thermoplasmata archaeon]